MNKHVSSHIKLLCLIIGILIILPSMEMAINIHIDAPPPLKVEDKTLLRSGPGVETLNFTLDNVEDFENFEDSRENITLFTDAGDNGKLRLSTGLPDVMIDGPFNSSGPFFAETIVMKSGGIWTPDATDTIEINARNFIMESGSIIDATGTGDNLLGKGDDGTESQWSGGGGGGGGAFGNNGGIGGKGARQWGGNGGEGGETQGAENTEEVKIGGGGGTGGDAAQQRGGAGSPGGGVILICAENIVINGTIITNGKKGTDTSNSPQGGRDTGGGGGGGSGGGILIKGNTIVLQSENNISTRGGDGGRSGDAWGSNADSGGGGGGGSGGRVKIFNGIPIIGAEFMSVDVNGGDGGEAGSGSAGNRKGQPGIPGGAGTFYTEQKEFESNLEHRLYGSYISLPLDTNNTTPHFGNITFSYDAPIGTLVHIYTQTAPPSETNPDLPGNWSEWSGDYSGSPPEITSPNNRWIRVKIVLRNTGVNLHTTPILDRLRIEYRPDERPTNIRLGVSDTSLNAAYDESVDIRVKFSDLDDLPTGIFTGKLKLWENSTGDELTLVDGKFTENENCAIIRSGEGEYDLNYTFTPEKYVRDGTWAVYFEVWDGATDRTVLDYNDTGERFTIFTNFAPSFDLDSLSLSDAILPIQYNYQTTISVEFTDEDPYPVNESVFSIELRKINGSAVYELIGDLRPGDVPELDIVESRGTYLMEYIYDPEDSTEEGLYEIYIDVEDNMGATSIIDYGDTDVTLNLLMNSPPPSPSWILPDETAEQTPRLAWSSVTDKDGDPVTYYVQIGTTTLGQDVLIRSSTGKNNFFDVSQPLPYGDYYVQVWAKDPYFFSHVYQEKMGIKQGVNSPPRAPSMIMPNFTREIFPKIEWSGAYDLDEDDLTYYIQIGLISGAGDVLPKRSVGSENYYQMETPLARGSEYFVQVWSFDGNVESFPREETLTVLTEGNHRPEPPTTIYPDITGDLSPTIFWTKGIDVDEDELTYYVQIGKAPGSGDVVHWSPTGTETSYTVPVNLSYGTYYVQVKCKDAVVESDVLEETMKIWATANIPPTPPTEILPAQTRSPYPDIHWGGADDANEDDRDILFYFIQIGANPDGNEFMSWQLTMNTFFNVSTFLPDGIYYIQIMTSDGKANSSVFQQKMYVGTFKPTLWFLEEILAIERGGTYEVKVNLSNQGTIPDRIAISFQDVNGITVRPKYSDFLISDIPLDAGEYKEIALTVTILNTYSFSNDILSVTARSMSGANTTASLTMYKFEETEEFELRNIHKEYWFWLIIVVIMFIVALMLLVALRRRRMVKDEKERVYTETVAEKAKAERRKVGGMVTRISDTPIMDPRAKRIAMAIYNAQSPQLAGPQRPDRLQLPSSTNLPNISIPDMAVGSTMSKKAHAIKALPQFSVVKDRGVAPAGQPDITGIQKEASGAQQPAKAPSVTMPGDIKLEPQVSSEKMSEVTKRVLEIQTRILQLRNDGLDVKEAEEKLMTANQYFGQMNMPALENTLSEIVMIFGKLEGERKSKNQAPEITPNIEKKAPPAIPAQQPQPPPSEAVPATPAAPPTDPTPEPTAPSSPVEAPPSGEAPSTEEPPSPPPENTPPPEGKKDVFSDLQKMLDGMK